MNNLWPGNIKAKQMAFQSRELRVQLDKTCGREYVSIFLSNNPVIITILSLPDQCTSLLNSTFAFTSTSSQSFYRTFRKYFSKHKPDHVIFCLKSLTGSWHLSTSSFFTHSVLPLGQSNLRIFRLLQVWTIHTLLDYRNFKRQWQLLPRLSLLIHAIYGSSCHFRSQP
jgi:hypothetical protein